MIEKYIKESYNMKTSSRGSNKVCYYFDDYVLLKGDFVNHGKEEITKRDKLNFLKANGVNVCRVLENTIIDNKRYELQERAKGEELYNFNFSHNIEGQKKYLSVLNSLSNQNINFFKKFIEDWHKILEIGLDVDPSKCSNFFYDGREITFIDLNLTNNYEKRVPWILREIAPVLRGGGLLWMCQNVYEEANEKVKIIYQKIGEAAILLDYDITNYISYTDPKGEYGLREYFNLSEKSL